MTESANKQVWSLWYTIVTKWFWLYLFALLTAPLWYLIRVILSHSLSVDDVGIIYSILSFVSLLSIYNDLWLTETLRYFLPQYLAKKKFSRIYTVTLLTFSVQFLTSLFIIYLLLWPFSEWLSVSHFKDSRTPVFLSYFLWYFLGYNFFQIIQSITISFQDTFQNKIIDFLRILWVALFTLFFFLFWFRDVSYYIFSRILWLFVALSVWVVLFYRKYWSSVFCGSWSWEPSEIKKYFGYALWTFLWMNASVLLLHIDQQMVVSMTSTHMAWLYTNFLSLLKTYTVFLTPLAILLFPLVSELMAKNSLERFSLLRRYVYTYFPLFSFSFSIIFFLFGPEIASFLYSSKFAFSWELLSVWWRFIVLPVLNAMSFAILSWLWMVRKKVILLFVAVILNILMNYFFIPAFWLYWAILWTWTWRLFLTIWSLYFVHRYYPIAVDWSVFFSSVLFLFVFAVFVSFWPYPYTIFSIVLFSWLLFLWLLLLHRKKIWDLYRLVRRG